MKKLGLILLSTVALNAQNLTLSGNLTITGNVSFNFTSFINCIFTPSYSCSQLANLFTTDPYSTVGGFTGYADFTVRGDVNGGTIWTSYSYPAVQTNGSLGVSNHLSYWDGTDWQFKSSIFTSAQVTNGSTGLQNYVSNEVPALISQNVSGTSYWYEAGLNYLTPPGGSGYSSQPSTNRIYIRACSEASQSAGPSCLSSVTNQFIGGNAVDSANFPISQNFTPLAVGSNCNRFNEPSLWYSSPTLYMTLGCSDPFQYAIYVFSTTNPEAHLGTWTWSYVSKFMTAAQANGACAASFGVLCGNSNLVSSCEMALAHSNGMPILVCEMSNAGVILGTIIFSASSLTPPVLNLNALGFPVILGYVTCSQCGTTGPETGPGYDPNYPNGVIMTLQQTGCVPNGPGCGTISGTFNQGVNTGLRP